MSDDFWWSLPHHLVYLFSYALFYSVLPLFCILFGVCYSVNYFVPKHVHALYVACKLLWHCNRNIGVVSPVCSPTCIYIYIYMYVYTGHLDLEWRNFFFSYSSIFEFLNMASIINHLQILSDLSVCSIDFSWQLRFPLLLYRTMRDLPLMILWVHTSFIIQISQV